jgi:hypothetical protein
MGKLIYSAIASADGYVEDAAGRFDWAAPDDEVLRFVNDLERPVGTYLFGRRMYETMLYWETAHTMPGQPSSVREFTGIWQAAAVPGARDRRRWRASAPSRCPYGSRTTGHAAVRRWRCLPQVPHQVSVISPPDSHGMLERCDVPARC